MRCVGAYFSEADIISMKAYCAKHDVAVADLIRNAVYEIIKRSKSKNPNKVRNRQRLHSERGG